MTALIKTRIFLFLLFIFSLFVFTRGINVHGLEYRDDEIFYFKSTQEMLLNKDFLTPTYFDEHRFQKPILFYWLVLASYKIFGASWFSARMVSAVFASLTVCLTWIIGRFLFSQRVAGLSAVLLMTIPMFFRHAKNVVPDMALNFFIVLAIYFGMRFQRSREEGFASQARSYSCLFFVACGLGFMIKGFAAVVLPIGVFILYILWNPAGDKGWRQKFFLLKEINFPRGIFILLALVLPWFTYMIYKHGMSYLNYMLVDETKNRLLGVDPGTILGRFSLIGNHILFYLRVIGSYFAPWSLFFFLAVIRFLFKFRQMDSREKGSIGWLGSWFLVVFCFFVPMYFVINHYILVLTTPFALLVSYFFLEDLSADKNERKIWKGLKVYPLIFILGMGCLAYVFLSVFLAGASPVGGSASQVGGSASQVGGSASQVGGSASRWWAPVTLVFFIAAVKGILTSRRLLVAPLTLCFFIIFVFAQSKLLEKAGLTTHATLRKFAETINRSPVKDYVIAVGSHDIHEKEFQVYFDKKIIKAGTSNEEETNHNLVELFSEPQRVYCLITKEDFDKYLAPRENNRGKIVQEDFIFRRRIYPDKKLLISLLTFDQSSVYNYFFEKVVLLLVP